MSQNLLNKYVWLVDTIYRHKYISFEKINELWLDDDMSEGLEILKQILNNCLNANKEELKKNGYRVIEWMELINFKAFFDKETDFPIKIVRLGVLN